MSIPGKVAGQTQSPQRVEQSAALEGAKRLNQKVIELYKLGKYRTAIPLAERVLAIYEKALGKQHPIVGTSLNNLARLYQNMGNYKKAKPLYQRSQAILKKALEEAYRLRVAGVQASLRNLAASQIILPSGSGLEGIYYQPDPY